VTTSLRQMFKGEMYLNGNQKTRGMERKGTHAQLRHILLELFQPIREPLPELSSCSVACLGPPPHLMPQCTGGWQTRRKADTHIGLESLPYSHAASNRCRAESAREQTLPLSSCQFVVMRLQLQLCRWWRWRWWCCRGA